MNKQLPGKTAKELIEESVRTYLDKPELQHEFITFSKNTLRVLSTEELRRIINFLVSRSLNIHYRDLNQKIYSIKRPVCPITSIKKLNQAKAEYKIAMITYIAQFGIELIGNAPCNYTPAFLESLANYCEQSTTI